MAPTAPSMSQIEENQATNKSGSSSTVVASLAALGSVIAASSCCLPLLPFLFAAGAAGTSAFVAQLRPYLLVLSVLLIAFGFYKSWRAKQCNCKPSRISTFLLSVFRAFRELLQWKAERAPGARRLSRER